MSEIIIVESESYRSKELSASIRIGEWAVDVDISDIDITTNSDDKIVSHIFAPAICCVLDAYRRKK